MPHSNTFPTTIDSLWKDAAERDSWHTILRKALGYISANHTRDGTASLRELLAVVSAHPRAKVRRFWRQAAHLAVESSDEFVRIERGRWGFAEGRSEAELARLRQLRIQECPKKPRRKAGSKEA